MTDGTTGFQVAPTEDEMNHVQDILKRALNAVVGMSQLQADVDMLRNTVQALQADTERLRQQNAGLDEALYQSRQSRDGLTTRLAEVQHDLDTSQRDARTIADENANLLALNESLREKLHSAEQSRDNAELRVMELEDELKQANAKLDTVRSLFAPEPVAKPVEPAPEPAPIVEDTRDDWAPGYIWDYTRRVYVRTEPDKPDGEAIPF